MVRILDSGSFLWAGLIRAIHLSVAGEIRRRRDFVASSAFFRGPRHLLPHAYFFMIFSHGFRFKRIAAHCTFEQCLTLSMHLLMRMPSPPAFPHSF